MRSGYRTLKFFAVIAAVAFVLAPALVADDVANRPIDPRVILAEEEIGLSTLSHDYFGPLNRLELNSASVYPTPDWMAEGDQDSAWFGRTIAGAGDVNNDGYGDLIVGSMLYDGDLEDEGMALVYHGSPSGLTSAPAWMIEGDEEEAEMGNQVAGAGDVNGDGYGDVIVGSLYYSSTSNAGKAMVFYGRPGGLATSPDWLGKGENPGDLFGLAVAGAGDVNGDGYDDVVVGARGYRVGTDRVGRVYAYYGSPGGLSPSPGWMATGDQDNSYFGMVVAGAGDVNGDGYDDVLVSAPYYDDPEHDKGLVYLYAGGPGGLSPAPMWVTEGEAAAAAYGFGIGGGGDVNNDGFDDIVIGSARLTAMGAIVGKAYLYLGGPGGPMFSPDWTVTGDQDGGYLGYGVALDADLNGDGFDDVMVGAPRYARDDAEEGVVFVYYGDVGGPSTTPDWIAESNQSGSYFGRIAGSAGDVNRDGYSDLFVGATLYDHGQVDEGAAFVFHGGPGMPGMLEASIYFDPRTLNLKSEGSYVGCAVQLPEGYDTREIDASTVMLNGIVPAMPGTPLGGGNKRDFKFDRGYVQALFCAFPDGGPVVAEMGGTPPIGHGAQFALHLSGALNDGTPWAGRDTSRVIHQDDCDPVECDIFPPYLDFGIVDRGWSADLQFTITNAGAGPALGMVSESCPEFEITAGGGPYLLDPGESVDVTVSFTPVTCGDKVCMIQTGSCGEVTAAGTAGPLHACDLVPATVDFGDVTLGDSKTERFRIRNSGCEDMSVAIGTPCPGFSIVSGGGSYTLAPGESRDVFVEFAPTSCGSYTCIVPTGSPYCHNVQFLGSSTGPVCSVFPDTLHFGTVAPGVSKDMTFTISNVGCGPFSGDVYSPYAAFVISAGGDPFTLNPGESQTVTVTYTGGTCGNQHGAELGLGTPSGLCATMMCFAETGGAGCEISPPSLAFGDVNIGSTQDFNFTIANNGCETLTGVISESCPEFSIVAGGGAYSLGVGFTRTVTVRFAPTSIGDKTCTITTGCRDYTCTGRGTSSVACSVSPTSIDFGTVFIGSCSDRSVTITNNSTMMNLAGTVALPSTPACSNYSIPVGGGAYSIPPGATHTFTVRYCPDACATDNCTVSTGCADVPMVGEGTGGGCAVSVDSLDFGTITVGGPSSVDKAFTITNTGCTVISGIVTESCTHYYLVGQVNYSLLPGESQAFAVRFMPEALGTHVCTIDTGAPCDVGIVCTGTLSSTTMASMEVYASDPAEDVKISFTLEKAGPISLKIYDAAGRLVRTLESGVADAGRHNRQWDRRTNGGAEAHAGVYFVKLEHAGRTIMKKAMLVK